jgi:hypothetical protein
MSGVVIRHLEKVTDVCPSQWYARTLDNRAVYIRFKHGQLSVNVGPVGGSISDAIATLYWYIEQVASDHEDSIEIEDVCRLTGISLSE